MLIFVRMVNKLKYFLIFIMILPGCSNKILNPTDQDLALAPVNGKNIHIESLLKGRALYINKCGKCHYLYNPLKFTDEKWVKEMPDMSRKSKITSTEAELILKYIFIMREAENAKKALK